MALVDEGKTEDQGLNHIAFYPTEACLIKMLYRSGYSHVYVFNVPPDHSDIVQVHTHAVHGRCWRPRLIPSYPTYLGLSRSPILILHRGIRQAVCRNLARCRGFAR